MFERNVIDNGYVRIIDTMGDDNTIVRAARVSFGGEDSKDPAGLINYLMRHRHTSPFEMCKVMMEVKAPIFVARQWMRHRTWSFNEISGRYVELLKEHHVPEVFNDKAENNKQGRSNKKNKRSREFICRSEEHGFEAFSLYEAMLERGIAPEQARMHLPLSTYTRFIASVDLHNLLHFLKLRTDSHAQAEIREYADAIEAFVEYWVPLTHAAWRNHVKDAVTFSAAAMDCIRALLAADGEAPDWDSLPTRERREVLEELCL